MSRRTRRRCRPTGAALAGVGLLAVSLSCPGALPAQRWCGANLIQTDGAPLGSPEAQRSLQRLAHLGANTVAVVPFLYQPAPDSARVMRGSAVSDRELVAGIRVARALGLRVLLKPHVWIPGHWAGEIEMRDEARWREWFRRYGDALGHYARLARREDVEALSVGVELRRTLHRPEWRRVIQAVRDAYPGTLTYVAHGADDLESVPFWQELDVAGVSLYPRLGPDPSRAALRDTIRSLARRTEDARPVGRPLWVSELGIRSARGAQVRPWESPEERRAPPDTTLQARVFDLWLDELRQLEVDGVWIWRWFSDPAVGGPRDTDFTPQGKAAEAVLERRWSGCAEDRG